MPRRKEERPQLSEGEVMVTSVYWRHNNPKYSDFRRVTTTVVDHLGKERDLGLIEFYFLNDEHHVSPHKHKTSGKPYNPTSASTKKFIREAVKGKQGPSSIFADAVNAAGGAVGCESVSDLPRNRQQVKNVRANLSQECKTDDFLELLDLCQTVKYLRNFQWTPLPRVVFSYDAVLDEIVKNCCQISSSCVLSIDTTYGIGNKFVTSTTYEHAQLLNCETGKRANLPGPAMFHVCERKEDFVYFSHSLVQQNEKFENVNFVGADRSAALKGFLQPLKGAVLLPCTKHVKDNIEMQLKSLGIQDEEKKHIMNDIFGDHVNCRKGLIDSESVDNYHKKLEILGEKWCRVEKGSEFFNYFQTYISDDMKVGMLSPVRKKIGLKENFYYNNAEECSHFKYKCKLREHKAVTSTGYGRDIHVSWGTAIKVYKCMVDEVRENIRLAVIGKGPYRLSPEAEHLQMSHQGWSKLSPEERRQHLAKLDPFSKGACCTYVGHN